MKFLQDIATRFRPTESTLEQIEALLEDFKRIKGIHTDHRIYGTHTWHFDQEEDDLRVCQLILQPDSSTSTHLHTKKDHYFYVLSGTLTVKIEDEPEYTVATGDYCLIEKNHAHLLSNRADIEVRLLEVMQPATDQDKIFLYHPHMERLAIQKIQETWSFCTDEMLETFLSFCRLSSEELIRQAEFTLDKPYGKNHIIRQFADFGLSFMQMKPGQSTSQHMHQERSEFFYVRSGTLTLGQDEGPRQLKRYEFGFSTPLHMHQLMNQSDELLEVLEIFTPPLLDDKVRLNDTYNRKLGNVHHLE